MQVAPPDAATRKRFLQDWHAATDTAVADKALVALSGGPDSSALLLLFAAIRTVVTQPHAATVDHGLRAASSREAGTAADLARAVGIPHAILRGTLDAKVGDTANLSARARELRYRLLEEHADAIGARWIVTAHHADDQLETMVMRLNRGSGLRGLSGVRAVQGRRVRPLLGWRRAELAAVVASAGITAVNDPSNVDDRFDRARLRKQLAAAPWLDPQAAARSAAALGEAEEAIAWTADLAERRYLSRHDGAITFGSPLLLPVEIRRRLVERCLRGVDPAAMPRGSAVTDLMARLVDPLPTTLGDVAVVPIVREQDGQLDHSWLFRRAPPRRGG